MSAEYERATEKYTLYESKISKLITHLELVGHSSVFLVEFK
jgi:hypothetical protein